MVVLPDKNDGRFKELVSILFPTSDIVFEFSLVVDFDPIDLSCSLGWMLDEDFVLCCVPDVTDNPK